MQFRYTVYLICHCFSIEQKLKCVYKQSFFMYLKPGKSSQIRNYFGGLGWYFFLLFAFTLWILVGQKKLIFVQHIEQSSGNGLCKSKCEGREATETCLNWLMLHTASLGAQRAVSQESFPFPSCLARGELRKYWLLLGALIGTWSFIKSAPRREPVWRLEKYKEMLNKF